MTVIKWNSKIILAKPEVTYGVSSSPLGANAMLMTDVELRPMEGQDVSRNLERPYLGAQEQFPVGVYSMLSGNVELVGAGDTGVAPAWSILMRICAVAETITPDDTPGDGMVEYEPISDSQESATLHFLIGASRYVLLGARGSAKLTLNAQGIPAVRFAITGLFTTPSEQSRPTPDLSAFQVPQVATNANTPTFTIGGTDFVLRNFGFDLGCKVEPRMLIGKEEIVITGKDELISCQIEAVPLSTYNPYSVAQNSERKAIVIEHGTVAGKRVKFEAPICQQKRPSGFANQQDVLEWPLDFTPLPDAGNDQWKLTLT